VAESEPIRSFEPLDAFDPHNSHGGIYPFDDLYVGEEHGE